MTTQGGIHIDSRARFEILGAILLAMFLSALDQTIVGTALPRIVSDLKGNDLYVWVVTIYLLTSTVTGPIYGKISDLYGRRPMMMLGVGLFLVGSVLSGVSQEMWQLIAARGFQGLGAGAIFPISLAVIGDLFTPRERGKYQGLFGAVFGISALIGPFLGGFLTDNLSWHWVFFVNVPVGLVSLYIIWRLLPPIRHPEAVRSIDYLGSAVFALAIVPILIGLTNKQTGAWTDPFVGGLILLGLAFSAAFVWVESRASEPIVPLGLFRNRTFSASVIAVFLAAFGFFGAIIFVPRWFQVVYGSSATESGYQMFPLLIGLLSSSIASGYFISRTGKYKWLVVASMAVLSVGLLLMTNLRAETELPAIWLWMIIAGVGLGPTMAAFTIVVQNAVPIHQLGVATSDLTFFRQVGGTVGLAIAGTLFNNALTAEIPKQLAASGVPQPLIDQFGSGRIDNGQISAVGDLGAQIMASTPAPFRATVEPLIPNIVAGFHEAFSVAIANALWIGVGAGMVAVLVVLFFLPELPLRQHFGESPSSEALAALEPSLESPAPATSQRGRGPAAELRPGREQS
ncbi:MAG TPA: MDR family MFS transporter [Candidatus Limnocylindria bacterium]|nr:MDR family MFS transporter [Candidatus Limnocylindria bacterium]